MDSTVRRLFLISLIFSFKIQANCIKSGTLKFVKEKSEILKSADYCFNLDKIPLLDMKCAETKKCLAIEKYSTMTIPLVRSAMGNPLHSKCFLLGGEPHIVEVKKQKGWKRTSLCFFSDGSFISVFNRLKYNPQ